MKIDNKIRDENLQCHINREGGKIPASSSGKIYKYKYQTGEEILPSDQRKVIEQVYIFFQEKLQKNKQKQLRIKIKIK